MFFVQTITDSGQKNIEIQVNKISKLLSCTVHKLNKIPTNGQYSEHVHAASSILLVFHSFPAVFPFYFHLPQWVTQTTLNADCMVDETRDAMVWEANCWIFCLASERNTMCMRLSSWMSNFKNEMWIIRS